MCNTTDTLGTRIAEKRQAMGYSQEYVAEQLGVSRQAVSKWETDQSAPDTYNLISLASLLGVSVEYIATGAVPAEHSAPMTSPTTQRSPLTAQHIAGFILLTVGLLGIIIGILLMPVIAILSANITLIGILFLTIKRHLVLSLSWLYSILGLVFISFFSEFHIFAPEYHGNTDYTIWLFITLAVLSLLIFAIALTIRTILHAFRHQK